jgi:hypothetical protein
MNRNYDEIIAEMLIQIDRHSEELTKQSAEMTKQSAEQTRQSQRAEESHQRFVQEMTNLRTDFLGEMRNLRQDFTEADTQLSAQLVHSAMILDIIKRNNLEI